MPPKEANPFGNPKPFLRAAAAGTSEVAQESVGAEDESVSAPQKSKKQLHRKDKVIHRSGLLVDLFILL
jgi:tRNA G26 N,N-dimethylase Trm1